ncbi:MAG: histidinol-phosphate transaminase [Moraxellaceae bacterium]|nr:histidinol-phosphate transaminase [Moraxellaceae bacterium]MDZ4298423.1 histidinol-phosphate transaminase [Moraxellaceae bacterium]MDZ4387182.1 histidinol-phosphate transaminase [Moraxellaceae bacterium]
MTDFLQQANLGVRTLAPYQPGKPIDELQRELGLTRVVKLASNENPLGPSPLAMQAITDMLADPLELARYPDGNGFVLKTAIAQRFQLDTEQIVLGNGSNDVLELVARAFLTTGDEAIYAQHAFAVYPLATQASGATGVCVPAKDYGHDLVAMAAAITERTKVIFLANPNNPTGTWFEAQDFADFMQKVSGHIIVLLDEAYGEFVSDPDALDGLSVLSKYPNLVVSRTFAKAYGLASLRVGYAAASKIIINILNRVRQPFNVNSLALVAAAAALNDDDFVQRSRELNDQGQQQWQAYLADLGLSALPSRGNFICVDFGKPTAPIFAALLREGVIVRPVANYELPHHLRISIGLPEENAFAADAIKRVLAASGESR